MQLVDKTASIGNLHRFSLLAFISLEEPHNSFLLRWVVRKASTRIPTLGT